MADGSNVTIRLRLSALPLLAGIEHLDVVRHQTRASKSNREYVEPVLRFEGPVDAFRREFLFDAQTSGGLLISVPGERSEKLVNELKNQATLSAVIVGDVLPRGESALLVTG
jgi:selenide,water dikinase